jgi:3-deoxy-D-manno-octulosonic-acid transferase
MAYLLNVAYLALIAAAFPWLLFQRLRHGKYREGWNARLFGRVPRRDSRGKCIWIHAVSVGEVNLLAPLLERWEKLHPDWECVISTTTQAGYHLALKRYAPRTVFYCPLDFTWSVRRAMQLVRPDLLVLTELELWPNLVAAAREHRAKVAIINGRLSDKSFRGYRRIGWLVRGVLEMIDLIAAQNEEYARRFRELGARPESVQITGSVKFDGARTTRDNPESRKLARLAGFQDDDVVFLAGSTQAPEEALALDAFERLAGEHPELRLVLVPRHPERFDEVAALLDRRGIPWQRRSKLQSRPLTPSGPEAERPSALVNGDSGRSRTPVIQGARDLPPRVLLVDAVGELGHWWGTAQIAFVGGSLTNRGGQNMIEPGGYGAAVAFGPNTWNFRDVVALFLERQAAAVVNSRAELEAFVRRCLNDPAYRADLGGNAQQLVLQQQGAADRTIALLNGMLDLTVEPARQDSAHAKSTRSRWRSSAGQPSKK